MNTSVSVNIQDQLIIDSLISIQKQLTYTILMLLFIIGNIGCLFNTIIFVRPYLISSSCSRYFLATSFANLFQIYIGLASHILDVGFAIHPYHYFSILCKFRNYFITVGGFLSQTYLLLACIDRYLISLNKSCYRQINTVYTANRIVLLVAFFWFIALSHMPIYSHISLQNQICFFSSLSYVFFISLHNLIISGCILPVLMVLFGFLTFNNIEKIRRQARAHRRQRRYHYLSLMLISNVFVSVIFTLIYTSGLIYISFFMLTKENIPSLREKTERRFISFIAIIFYYVPFAISFYVNILTSQRFRCELKKILYCKKRRSYF